MRKIRLKLGDVFLAPFDYLEDDYKKKRPLGIGERVFAMQIVGMSHHGMPTVALFDGVYSYSEDLDPSQIVQSPVLAIIELVPLSLSRGEFKRISNQPIDPTMPYMAYEVYSLGKRYISPASNGNLMVPSEEVNVNLPRVGFSATGGIMYELAHVFILDEVKDEWKDDLERHANYVRVRAEALARNFFNDAKDPEWVRAQIASTR